MKKILLGTTALIGATLMVSAASAQDPKVTIGGFNTFEAGFVSDDKDTNKQSKSFRNNTELHFNVAGKTDAGLGYGAQIDLEGDINGDGTNSGSLNQGLNARRTYAWLEGDNWGHFEFGSNEGAAHTLKVDASKIARATGGIDGDWSFFSSVNQNGVESNGSFAGTIGRFISSPRLTVEHGPDSAYVSDVWNNSTKVTYYTPRASGFQLGVSYTPKLTNRGQLTNRIETSGDAHDILSGGINYERQFNDIGFAAAVTGQTGNSDVSTREDINAWNAGAKLSYMGFSLAGSYGDLNDGLALKTANSDADYWTAGLGYETGPVGASVTYFQSNIEQGTRENELELISAGVDYKLAPGLTPFAEYTWYSLDAKGAGTAGQDNEGGVFIVGSQLSF